MQPAIRVLTGVGGLEPQVLQPAELTPRPAEPARVRVASLTLDPGGSYRPPTGACQDVLLLVREGELRVVGAGIAPASAPGTLYPGDAVRFAAEADGLVQNLGDRQARSVVAFVRAEGAGEPSLTEPGPTEPGDMACEAEPEDRDPLRRELRVASVRTTPALDDHGGALRARVLLHADGARRGGLSLLEGDPGLVVAEHRHAEAAEVLFVERGGGALTVAGRSVRLAPGAAAYVPADALHAFVADPGEPFVAVRVFIPSGPEDPSRGG